MFGNLRWAIHVSFLKLEDGPHPPGVGPWSQDHEGTQGCGLAHKSLRRANALSYLPWFSTPPWISLLSPAFGDLGYHLTPRSARLRSPWFCLRAVSHRCSFVRFPSCGSLAEKVTGKCQHMGHNQTPKRTAAAMSHKLTWRLIHGVL